MKNIKSEQVKTCIIIGSDEFERILNEEICPGQTVDVDYAIDGLSVCVEENDDFDLTKSLSSYFDVKVSSIHAQITDCDYPISIWICCDNSDKKDHDICAYNDGFISAYNNGFRDAENSIDKVIVSPKYKGLVMAALKEAYEHELLGSIGDKDACSLYHRLKYEDYCKERGKSYDELTEDDFEEIALKEAEERERDYDD